MSGNKFRFSLSCYINPPLTFRIDKLKGKFPTPNKLSDSGNLCFLVTNFWFILCLLSLFSCVICVFLNLVCGVFVDCSFMESLVLELNYSAMLNKKTQIPLCNLCLLKFNLWDFAVFDECGIWGSCILFYRLYLLGF